LAKTKADKRTAGRRTKGKQTKAKQAEGRRCWWGLPRLAWLLIALAIAGIVVLVRLYPPGQPPPDYMGPPRAAIVDQLSDFQENPAFIAEVTRQLEDYGLEVDLYQGDEIDVAFYRELPARGYRLIVFRAHSGILAEHEVVHHQTLLFTNEEYSSVRHWDDQFAGRLHMATVGEGYPMLFGIPPEFITDGTKGKFDDTVIIMMGCAGIYLKDLAKAFIEQGASAYLAWNASVDLHYVDRATPYLIRQLCSENVTIQEAVDSTMAVEGPDPNHSAELHYYPSGTGGKTLDELIG
jgi:hypothetical protein